MNCTPVDRKPFIFYALTFTYLLLYLLPLIHYSFGLVLLVHSWSVINSLCFCCVKCDKKKFRVLICVYRISKIPLPPCTHKNKPLKLTTTLRRCFYLRSLLVEFHLSTSTHQIYLFFLLRVTHLGILSCKIFKRVLKTFNRLLLLKVVQNYDLKWRRIRRN